LEIVGIDLAEVNDGFIDEFFDEKDLSDENDDLLNKSDVI